MKETVFLRESTFEDCQSFARWESNPAVTRFFTIDEGKNYEETVREFLEREADDSKKQFTVCVGDLEQGIGRIYISNIDRHYDSLDITRIYIADTHMRGKGYGQEALRLTLKWAFEEMHCQRVTLDHFSDNIIAAALYEKMGFLREGIMRNAGKKNGEYLDLCLMSMLREEYFKL